MNANKNVTAGIETAARRFKENTLFTKRGVIPRFFDEIYQYKWKPNSTKDELLKEYDDILGSLRYAIYSNEVIKKQRNKGNQFDTFRAGFGL